MNLNTLPIGSSSSSNSSRLNSFVQRQQSILKSNEDERIQPIHASDIKVNELRLITNKRRQRLNDICKGLSSFHGYSSSSSTKKIDDPNNNITEKCKRSVEQAKKRKDDAEKLVKKFIDSCKKRNINEEKKSNVDNLKEQQSIVEGLSERRKSQVLHTRKKVDKQLRRIDDKINHLKKLVRNRRKSMGSVYRIFLSNSFERDQNGNLVKKSQARTVFISPLKDHNNFDFIDSVSRNKIQVRPIKSKKERKDGPLPKQHKEFSDTYHRCLENFIHFRKKVNDELVRKQTEELANAINRINNAKKMKDDYRNKLEQLRKEDTTKKEEKKSIILINNNKKNKKAENNEKKSKQQRSQDKRKNNNSRNKWEQLNKGKWQHVYKKNLKLIKKRERVVGKYEKESFKYKNSLNMFEQISNSMYDKNPNLDAVIKNASLQNQIKILSVKNNNLCEMIDKWQKKYWSKASCRLEYQKTMNYILTSIEIYCKDKRLAHDAYNVAKEIDSEKDTIMVKLKNEYGNERVQESYGTQNVMSFYVSRNMN